MICLLSISLMMYGISATNGISYADIDVNMYNKNACAPLALAAVGEYLGVRDSFQQAFHFMPPSGEYRSLSQIKDAAERIGLTSVALRYKTYSMAQFYSPAIIRLNPGKGDDAGHFVVVFQARDDGRVLVLDPPQKPFWIHLSALSTKWDGVALHLASDVRHLPNVSRGNLSLPSKVIAGLILTVVCVLCARFGLRSWFSAWDLKQVILCASSFASALACYAFIGLGLSPLWNSPKRDVDVSPSLAVLHADVKDLKSAVKRVPAHFKLHNNTRKRIEIKEVISSCTCAKPELERLTIDPGKDVMIKVEVLPPVAGSSEFAVTVNFKDESTAPVVLNGIISLAASSAVGVKGE